MKNEIVLVRKCEIVPARKNEIISVTIPIAAGRFPVVDGFWLNPEYLCDPGTGTGETWHDPWDYKKPRGWMPS